MKARIIIGIAGPIGAGKSSIADILISQYGFCYLGFGILVKQILKREGKEITRKRLQEKGKQIIKQIGCEGIVDLLLENADAVTNYIIDGIRHIIEVVNYLKQLYGQSFRLIFVDAPTKVRFERVRKRMQYEDIVTIEKFREHENDSMEKNVALLKKEAFLIVNNTRSREYIEETISEKWGQPQYL